MAPYGSDKRKAVVEDADIDAVKSSLDLESSKDSRPLQSDDGLPIASTSPKVFAVRDDNGGNEQSSSRSVTPGKGAIDPNSINMGAFLALFAILGAALVLTAIWFFFWAKNGGFVWKKDDWDDYKTTVLRRKDADGKTYSNATPSTNLGGGSVVHGQGYHYDADYDSRYHGPTDTEMSQKSRVRMRLEAAKERIFKRKNNDEDSDVQAYRHEKAARVGGINADSEATYSNSGDGYDSRVGGGDTRIPGNYIESEITESTDYSRPQRQPRRDYSFVGGEEQFLSDVGAGPSHRRSPSRHNSRRHRDDVYSEVTQDTYDGTEYTDTPSYDHRISRASQRRRDRERSRPRSRATYSSSPSKPQSRPPRHSRAQSRSQSRAPPARSTRSRRHAGYAAPLDMSSHGGSYEYSGLSESEPEIASRGYRHPVGGLSKGYRRTRRDPRRRRRDSLSESEAELV